MISRLTLLLPLAWRNLWRNSRRSLLVVLAVAVGTMSIIDFTALMQAWARSTVSACSPPESSPMGEFFL